MLIEHQARNHNTKCSKLFVPLVRNSIYELGVAPALLSEDSFSAGFTTSSPCVFSSVDGIETSSPKEKKQIIVLEIEYGKEFARGSGK